VRKIKNENTIYIKVAVFTILSMVFFTTLPLVQGIPFNTNWKTRTTFYQFKQPVIQWNTFTSPTQWRTANTFYFVTKTKKNIQTFDLSDYTCDVLEDVYLNKKPLIKEEYDEYFGNRFIKHKIIYYFNFEVKDEYLDRCKYPELETETYQNGWQRPNEFVITYTEKKNYKKYDLSDYTCDVLATAIPKQTSYGYTWRGVKNLVKEEYDEYINGDFIEHITKHYFSFEVENEYNSRCI